MHFNGDQFQLRLPFFSIHHNHCDRCGNTGRMEPTTILVHSRSVDRCLSHLCLAENNIWHISSYIKIWYYIIHVTYQNIYAANYFMVRDLVGTVQFDGFLNFLLLFWSKTVHMEPKRGKVIYWLFLYHYTIFSMISVLSDKLSPAHLDVFAFL